MQSLQLAGVGFADARPYRLYFQRRDEYIEDGTANRWEYFGMRMFAFAVIGVILTSATFAAPDQKSPPDRPPSLMTSKEIRAYNEGLDSTHPYFIRCRKDPVVGSLVRNLRVCRTNYEWKRFAEMGNDSGREILGDVGSAPINGPGPIESCPRNRC